MLAAILAGVLTASLLENLVLALTVKRGNLANRLDRADAAMQLDSLLTRVHTADLVLEPSSPSPLVDPLARKYVSEFTLDDEYWNDTHEPEVVS